MVVERSTIMAHLFSKPSCSTASDAVLSALLSVFSRYVRRMRKSKEGEEVYSWVRAKWEQPSQWDRAFRAGREEGGGSQGVRRDEVD